MVGLGYDAQGNLANKSGASFDFDYGNRLRGASGNGVTASSYVYDGLGRRVRDYTSASKYSLYSQSGQLAFASDARKGTRHVYVYLGGSLVAVRDKVIATGAVSVKYQHTDALGSPTVITDANRTVLERREYEPYGKQLTPTPQDGPGYTGHVFDAATGLVYAQQRYYDDDIGRFLSADPVTLYGSPVGQFNRYRYGNNNPYRFYDPDGRCTGSRIEDDEGRCRGSGEFTTTNATALVPKKITSDMVESVGPDEATEEQVDQVVEDVNDVGKVAKAAGDSRAIRAFNKIEEVKLDSSDWDSGTWAGGGVAPTAVAFVMFNARAGRGAISINSARYFRLGGYYRVFRLMHEVLHLDSVFDDQKIQQLAAGCVAWSCQYERDVEIYARSVMNAGWAGRDE